MPLKFQTEYLTFNTRKHRAYIHITPQIEAIVNKSGIKDGMVLVSAMHITAGVYVNDDENGLIQDIDEWLESLHRPANHIATTKPARTMETLTSKPC
jgi:thiamine phosphate synthase YjbQ (UPF0047 family)